MHRSARALRGKRAYRSALRNIKWNTTLVAGHMIQVVVLTRVTDSPAFEAYVQRVLAPSLVARQVVGIDSISAHKNERIRGLGEARSQVAVPVQL